MTFSSPYNFPVSLVLLLLEDLPLELIKKHHIAVHAWKDVCKLVQEDKGMIHMISKKVFSTQHSSHYYLWSDNHLKGSTFNIDLRTNIR